MLGIVVTANLDSGLLVSTLADAGSPDVPVEVCESVALAGIWSLCWFDVSSIEPGDPHARRKRLLDTLLFGTRWSRAPMTYQGDDDEPEGRRVFLPVLTRMEGQHEVDVVLDDLRALYPTLVTGRNCFVRDPAFGGLSPSRGHRLRLVRSG